MTSQREDMKWIEIKTRDVKKLIENELEQEGKFSIAT
jgi:hypothetical protein